jgi:uncharacterized repeat protein (TIGR03803 family)
MSKHKTRSHAVLFILAVGVAACSQKTEQYMIPAGSGPGVAVRADTHSNFKTIFEFDGAYGGSDPTAGLIAKGTDFYGTTTVNGLFGNGNVYRLSDGHEKVLHSFNYDGHGSNGKLLLLGESLYGTSAGGGARNRGTVFSVRLAGKVNWVHSFKGSPDGEYPSGPLVDLNGALYGTTEYGGNGGACENYTCGTVFKMSTSGSENVIYNFHGGDGWGPQSGLIKINGLFYGTTKYGGQPGNGVVFSLTPAGKEEVVYAFSPENQPSDGRFPNGLVALNGTLYGSTVLGGPNDDGTVFSVTPDGKERVLHSFGSKGDGSVPEAALIVYKGKLYGTTSAGGTGNGTVFEVSTSGAEHVLHDFTGRTDGSTPLGSLLELNGKLYGTTSEGGATIGGAGTVYELTP